MTNHGRNGHDRARAWQWFLLRRLVAYAVLGGLFLGLAGGVLMSLLLGNLAWWIVRSQNGLYMPTHPLDVAFTVWHWEISSLQWGGFQWGFVLGARATGLAGALCFAFAAILMPPDLRLLPPRRIVTRALAGMASTIGALAVCFAVLTRAERLSNTLLPLENLLRLSQIILALLVLGEVAGVAWGWRRRDGGNDE